MPKAMKGFTLIELMIVLTILGIISMVAFPSYQEYVRRGERTAAMTFVSEIAQRQEVVFNNTRAYADSLSALGLTLPSKMAQTYQSPSISRVQAAAGTVPSYTIVLTPTTSGIMKNDGSLVYCSSGQRFRDVDNSGGCTKGSGDKDWEEK